MPSYRTIDPAFPIHSPYPSPSPAPAPRLLYATNLPKHLRIDKNAAPVHDPCLPEIDDVKVGCLVIEKCVVVRKLARQKDPTVDTPLQGPSKLGKMDPYDEGTLPVLYIRALYLPMLWTFRGRIHEGAQILCP